jgi:hypothetical protein
VIMKIGGWRTRSVFERYAIVSRNDIADAMLLLQHSEKLNDPLIGHIIGHSDVPAQKHVNLRNVN